MSRVFVAILFFVSACDSDGGIIPDVGADGAITDSASDGSLSDAAALDASQDDAVIRPPDPADWAARSEGAAVTMATNFDMASDVFDFARDASENYEWEQTLVRSGGGALKILVRADDGTSGWDWWRFLDVPFGSQESGLRDEYWLTYSVYIPDDYYNWIFSAAGSKKFSITSSHPSDSVNPVSRAPIQFPIGNDRRTGSSVPNEVVIDDTQQTMWVTIAKAKVPQAVCGAMPSEASDPDGPMKRLPGQYPQSMLHPSQVSVLSHMAFPHSGDGSTDPSMVGGVASGRFASGTATPNRMSGMNRLWAMPPPRRR